MEQFFKFVYALGLLDFAVGHFIKKEAQIALPERQKVNQVGDNDAFEPGFGKHVAGITKVGILADDGFGPGVLDHIIEFMGCINGGHRYKHSPHFLDP